MASDFSKFPHVQGARNLFIDKGQDLTIKHVPTGFQVEFPAFLDMFSDAYNSQWTAEDVYGRMDPISTFVNTKRAISVSWFVPADSFEHAEENLLKVNKLIGFLYPLYDNSRKGGATVINQGPLMKISFGNLIRNANTGRGLLGYVNGITFDPLLEYGMFNRKPDKDSSASKNIAGGNSQNNEYYPKTFRLNFEFTVLHEHELGYKRAGSVYVYNAKGKHHRVDEQTFPYSSRAGIDRQAKHDDKVRAAAAKKKADDEARAAAAARPAATTTTAVKIPTPKTKATIKATKKAAAARSKSRQVTSPKLAQTPPLANPDTAPPIDRSREAMRARGKARRLAGRERRRKALARQGK